MPLPPVKFKTSCLLAALVIISQQVQSQDFVIKHDLLKDNTIFYRIDNGKDTAVVKEIGVKKPGRITVNVDNFNPFYWNAKVTTFKRQEEDNSSFIGVFISHLIQVLGAPGFPTSRAAFDPTTLKRLRLMYDQLGEYSTQLTELKYDVHKTESEIKTGAKEIKNSVLMLTGMDSLDIRLARRMGKALDDTLGQSEEAPFTKVLTHISTTYKEIVNTSFRFSFNVNVNPDLSELKLQIFSRQDSAAIEKNTDTLTKSFPIKSGTSLRLRNSVGVSFTYFKDKNRSYYIKPDMTIASGKADYFTPVLSTFINFYNYKPTGPEWGGSFGFGVAVLGGDKAEFSFMLGLCRVLGRNEPIILSAGIAGSKVKGLADGWKVGATAPSLTFDIPTLSQFRVGGYISVSFNLKNIASGKRDD